MHTFMHSWVTSRLMDLYTKEGYLVLDAVKHEDIRKRGIDFILIGKVDEVGHSAKKFKVVADERICKTRNFFIELGSHRGESGFDEGWFYTSDADYLVYHDVNGNKGYIIDWLALRAFAKDSEVTQFDNKADNCKTDSVLVPVSVATTKGFIINTYTL